MSKTGVCIRDLPRRGTEAVLVAATFSICAVLSADGAFAGPEPGDHQAVSVEVAKPQRRRMVRKLAIPATLAPDESVDLFSKISGYIEEINVDIGSRVRRGDLLARIAVPEMADELLRAEAVLRARQATVRALEAKAVQAQRMVDTAAARVRRYVAEHEIDQINLDRKQELHDGNAIPQQALDEARGAHAVTEAQLLIALAQVAGAKAEATAVQADVDVAKADVMVARADLSRLKTLMSYAEITAPFDGVITVRSVDRGAFVRSAAEGDATSMLRIVKVDRIRVVLEIPESDSSYVRVGTEVSLDIKATGRPPVTGKVARMAGAIKPGTRTMRVEVDIDNSDGSFSPGMYAASVVILETSPRALMIPSKAVHMDGGTTVVFISNEGVARSRPVVIGYDDGIWAEIRSGLQGEESVITATSGAVVPGSPVVPAS